ncbi:hypothetical protein TSTA_029500 [Talaromyces stipitatus ATCC 10500]|uniref:Uncharacterized protein n=1 Tax=Talaromyces stipitatus (strain ATCC 10500 / CBS 375.48 / QM 6759 / NRRL 1006) TaxID=441959 RepID=B8M568_TALSN|nr:uncharacterized protein TSTA_029500 [Talaromyces stipitatus ATCC 10500]EED19674.1 hypothetical protein TSTA_029500 [Talaromyces stipitatus ATCC 10500]
MSATLRFPFQASLDGSSLVETDGCLYYGLDISHGIVAAELPAQGLLTPDSSSSESDPEPGLGLGLNLDGDGCEKRGQNQQLDTNGMSHPPRWDSLRDTQAEESFTPRPAPIPMHPHRIYTSDQQRFAREHEMTATEVEEEENNMICESPSTSTLTNPLEETLTLTETERTIRLPVPLTNQLPRYYATPLIKDDPLSTPVAIYGLEKPSDHIPKKKAPAVLRQRNSNPSAAQARPSSRHLHPPSPLSSTVSLNDRVEEQRRPSTSSTRRLSMFLGRTSNPNGLPSTGVSRPAIGSISSSGSSATTSTMRSAVTTASEASTASSIPTPTFTQSPTTLDGNQKPASPSPLDHNTLRRKTTPINPNEPTPISRQTSRRNTIFNFSKPKILPMMYHRSGIQSSDNLSTIRAVTNDQTIFAIFAIVVETDTFFAG